MAKKRVLLLGACGIVLFVGLAVSLILMIKHEPEYYPTSKLPEGKERRDLSNELMGDLATLWGHIDGGQGDWEVTISQDALNAFFEEDFIRVGNDAKKLRDQGVSEPRVILEEDRMRLAFRYGNEPWSTILNFDVRVWLAPKAMNTVAIQFQNRRAGSLPISGQFLFDRLTEVVKAHGIEVKWYRYEGHPVAVLRFESKRSRPSWQLRAVRVEEGQFKIVGSSGDVLLTSFETIAENETKAEIKDQ